MSMRLRLLNRLLRLVVKPGIARTRTPEQAARGVRRAALLARQPPHLRFLQRPGGLCWISAGPCVPRRVILYFHGGGFISGSPWTHRGMLGTLSLRAGVEVCAARYPLLQEAPFPASFDAACAAWGRLLRLGYEPGDIVLGGDSAGGGLALALLAWCCGKGTPPRAALAFSPWTDLAMTGATLATNARADPLLPAARMSELVEIYLRGADPRDPRASPLYAAFPGAPPVWLSWADTEILRDDVSRMAEVLRDAGAEVQEDRHPTAPHVWQLFNGWIPEADRSLAAAGRFVQASFDDSSR